MVKNNKISIIDSRTTTISCCKCNYTITGNIKNVALLHKLHNKQQHPNTKIKNKSTDYTLFDTVSCKVTKYSNNELNIR